MDERQLRKLKRSQLLEILYAQNEKIDQLQEENEKLKEQLSSKLLEMKKAGSLAEQAVKITGLFEKAQEAANLYLQNVYRIEGMGAGRGSEQASQSRMQVEQARQPEAIWQEETERRQASRQREAARRSQTQRASQALGKNRKTRIDFLNDDEWD